MVDEYINTDITQINIHHICCKEMEEQDDYSKETKEILKQKI